MNLVCPSCREPVKKIILIEARTYEVERIFRENEDEPELIEWRGQHTQGPLRLTELFGVRCDTCGIDLPPEDLVLPEEDDA